MHWWRHRARAPGGKFIPLLTHVPSALHFNFTDDEAIPNMTFAPLA